jgi:hypothetical protein
MPKGGGNEDRAKVKLRVIEFELEGGNASVENSIRQLTQALATRTNGAPARVAAPKPRELGGGDGVTDDVEAPVEVEFADGDEPVADAPAAKAKAKNNSKPRVPEYKHDLDMIGNGLTFKAFVEQKDPKKSTQRHLAAAFWLKEHGGSPTINIDKVFTCYKTVGWPTNQMDWDANFRSQVRTNRLRRVTPGEYAITPIGENDVRTMDGAE